MCGLNIYSVQPVRNPVQTQLDCLVCFMAQALSAARLSTDDPGSQRKVVNEVGRMLAGIDLRKTPPENAVSLYELIAELTGNPDPFAGLKKQSNDFALSIRDRISRSIDRSADPLRTALHFAACGNIIDYAAQHSFDAATAMADCGGQPFILDDYASLQERLTTPEREKSKVLYLADNCGELVFDGLVVRELQQLGHQVTLAVRGAPIINDATMEDIRACGLDRLCRVIENGTNCPGTPLQSCNAEFQQVFQEADVILSKGMGNFETLSDIKAPIFFLFTVKCVRVASYLRDSTGMTEEQIAGAGEMIFMEQRHPTSEPG